MNNAHIANTQIKNAQSFAKQRDVPVPFEPSKDAINFSDYALKASLSRSFPEPGYKMEEDGIALNQSADDIWLGKQPNTRAVDDFLKLSGMTLAERIRFYYLEDRNMTESDLLSLPAPDREEIEAEILRLIEEAIEAQREGDEKNKSDEKPAATVEPTAAYEFSAYKLLSSLQTKPGDSSGFEKRGEVAASVVAQDPIFTLFKKQGEQEDL